MKTFVLDTNVLIHDPKAVFGFADNKIIIPMTVVEELDNFKRVSDERGRNSRAISRILDGLRKKGKLSEGVKLENGGTLKVQIDEDVPLKYNFLSSKADHRILGAASLLQKNGDKVIFVSKDINLRIKAEALGIIAQDYEKEKVKLDELYTGWGEAEITPEDFELFHKNKYIAGSKIKFKRDIFANELFVLKDSSNPNKTILVKYAPKNKRFVPFFHENPTPWGMKPLNIQQRFALELLLCNEITLVTLIGVAGAGKTLLSLACGLQKVVEEKQFRHLLVARPIVPMGHDIGFLPGTKEEKLTSWMGAIYDNLDFLMDKSSKNNEPLENAVNYLFESGMIEIEALTFIRGRSLPQQFIIIDDAQNLTPHEIKTIISRAGQGTKIVLTGDPLQIDNPYLDAESNGLTNLVEKFKGQEIFGHLNFSHSERSPLAGLAAELL